MKFHKIYAIVFFMATISADPAFSGETIEVKSNSDSFKLFVNTDFVNIIPNAVNGNDLLIITWARVYREPLKIWENSPLVSTQTLGVSASCIKNAVGIRLLTEEFKSSSFDVIKKIEHSKESSLKLISDLPGMAEIRDYVCANRDKWHVVPVK